MIEAVKFWNEPNNLSHWDFHADPEWKEFANMTRLGIQALRANCPHMRVVLGGISPIDPGFLSLLQRKYRLLDEVDAIALHGFPLDWNHWQINDWPRKLDEVRAVVDKPIWVTEVGASSFGADEVQAFGLQRTTELLVGRAERVFWYSLLDLPPTWEATTRHKESEGSSYYRHFYMGLIRADGTPKPALRYLDPQLGICQWFHYEDHRLAFAVEWLRHLGVRKLRTGLSWADWYRPNAAAWFDQQMDALADFDVTLTLCFTPPSIAKNGTHTGAPQHLEDFAAFVDEISRRYLVPQSLATKQVQPTA